MAAFPRLEFGLLCLFTLVAVAFGVAKLRMSRFGSAMLAVRANERSAAGVGVNVVRVKVLSFALASFIAGLGGCLLAYRRSVVTFDSFTALGGLGLVSTAYLAGITSVFGGLTAGVLAASGIVFIAARPLGPPRRVVPGHHRRRPHPHADLPSRGRGQHRSPRGRLARRATESAATGRPHTERREVTLTRRRRRLRPTGSIACLRSRWSR